MTITFGNEAPSAGDEEGRLRRALGLSDEQAVAAWHALRAVVRDGSGPAGIPSFGMSRSSLAPVLLSLLFVLDCQRADPPPAVHGQPARDPAGAATADPKIVSVHQLTVRRLDGTAEAMSAYQGKVALVVNTASECGYTPQYEGLEALYRRRRAEGFVVLGFPSNDFGGQEPGSSTEIAAFCKKNYGVTFPMFEKVVTKGAAAAPLYLLLASKHGPPAWNFHKYLVGRDGLVRAAFASSVGPEDAQLAAAIDEALAD